MIDWLIKSPEAVVALVALAQPWIYWAYITYFRKGTLDVHRTGNIEVGFSTFGGTIGIQGTLRAVNRDLFVSRMEAKVVRESDNSTHTLEWGAFRPPVVLVGSSDRPIEMPAGFLMQPTAPHRYNILFFDTRQQGELNERLTDLNRLWLNDLQTHNVAPQDALARYAIFNQTIQHVETYTAVDRLNYWQRGTYSLTVTIHTTRPNQVFTERYRFQLTDADAARLRLNAVSILRSGLSLDANWDFVYTPYR
jgi:hypothetical protein